jgi:hypothetical protein
MPFWIEGWIEATRTDGSEQDEHAWSGVIRIGPIVDGADEVSERLFGLAKGLVASGAANAVAANRGIPENPSAELRAELEGHRTHEREHGSGEFGGYTFATWTEISAARDSLPGLAESEWALAFDLADRLARDPKFSSDRVRVVVWYNW